MDIDGELVAMSQRTLMNGKVLGVSVLEIQLMQEVGGCQGRKDGGMGKGWTGRVMRYRGDLQSQTASDLADV